MENKNDKKFIPKDKSARNPFSSDKPKFERSDDFKKTDRAESDRSRPRTERPYSDSRSERPNPFSASDRARSDRPSYDRSRPDSRSERPNPFAKSDRANSDRSGLDRPKPDRARSEEQGNDYHRTSKFEVKVKRTFRPRKKNMPAAELKEDDGSIRLNRYIANAGVSSRREADEFIKSGLVTVNGKVVTEMGVKVMLGDDVRFNNERISPEKKVYILLNKPKDYVTTMEDPNAKKTVMELVAGACKERVYPVGRLDRNTTGVLMLTNDGEMTKKLTHPKFNKKKIYHITLDKNLKKQDLEQISQGIELEDGIVSADAISYIDNVKTEIGVEIHSGKNRVIRRIFEHLHYNVKKLDRVYFAGLTKKGLTRGHWRFLTEKEIQMLKMGAYE